MSTKVSANWFPKEERIVATNVGITFSSLGSAFGFLLPIIFVDGMNFKLKHQLLIISGQEQIQNMFYFLVAVQLLILVMIIMFF